MEITLTYHNSKDTGLFETVMKSDYEGFPMSYGIIYGNEAVILIKLRQNGNIEGFNNNYLEIAKTINEKYGYSVVVASHFEKGIDSLAHAIETIKSTITPNPIIYYLGISKGASVGAYYGYKYEEIKRMLLVSPSLIINLQKLLKGGTKFSGEQLIFATRSLDPFFPYFELINKIENSVVSTKTIENTDNNFNGNLSIITNLVEKYLI